MKSKKKNNFSVDVILYSYNMHLNNFYWEEFFWHEQRYIFNVHFYSSSFCAILHLLFFHHCIRSPSVSLRILSSWGHLYMLVFKPGIIFHNAAFIHKQQYPSLALLGWSFGPNWKGKQWFGSRTKTKGGPRVTSKEIRCIELKANIATKNELHKRCGFSHGLGGNCVQEQKRWGGEVEKEVKQLLLNLFVTIVLLENCGDANPDLKKTRNPMGH